MTDSSTLGPDYLLFKADYFRKKSTGYIETHLKKRYPRKCIESLPDTSGLYRPGLFFK